MSEAFLLVALSRNGCSDDAHAGLPVLEGFLRVKTDGSGRFSLNPALWEQTVFAVCVTMAVQDFPVSRCIK